MRPYFALKKIRFLSVLPLIYDLKRSNKSYSVLQLFPICQRTLSVTRLLPYGRFEDVLDLNQSTCQSSHIQISKELPGCSASDRKRSSAGLILNGLRPFERTPFVRVWRISESNR